MTNITELLKDAPKGMKLYSPLFGEVEFNKINSVNAVEVIVTCTDGTQGIERFHSNGTYISRCPDAECLLFPSKDCRTWEWWKSPVEHKFKVGSWIANDYCAGKVIALIYDAYLLDSGQGIPYSCENNAHLWTIEDAKDGDVLATTNNSPFIYRKTRYNNNLAYYYAGIDVNGNFTHNEPLYHFGPVENTVPATREQRDLLFAKISEAGYEWDADKKELRKIQPHYDIANFKPFDKVLVRDSCTASWNISLFGCMGNGDFVKKFRCLNAHWNQCIPYEGNEHLLGTTDMCPEEYINW